MAKEYKVKITVESNLSKIIKSVDQDVGRAARTVKNVQVLQKAAVNTMNFTQKVLVSLGTKLGVNTELMNKFANFSFKAALGLKEMNKEGGEYANSTVMINKETGELLSNTQQIKGENRAAGAFMYGMAAAGLKAYAISEALKTTYVKSNKYLKLGLSFLKSYGVYILQAFAAYKLANKSLKYYIENTEKARDRTDELKRSSMAWAAVWKDIKLTIGEQVFKIKEWFLEIGDIWNRGVLQGLGLESYAHEADKAAAIADKLGNSWENQLTTLQGLGYASEDLVDTIKDETKTEEERMGAIQAWIKLEEYRIEQQKDFIRNQILLIQYSGEDTEENRKKTIILNRHLKALDRESELMIRKSNQMADDIKNIEEDTKSTENLIDAEERLRKLRQQAGKDYLTFQAELMILSADDKLKQLENERGILMAKHNQNVQYLTEDLEFARKMYGEQSAEYVEILNNMKTENNDYTVNIIQNAQDVEEEETRISDEKKATEKQSLLDAIDKANAIKKLDDESSKQAYDAALEENLMLARNELERLGLMSTYYDEVYNMQTASLDDRLAQEEELHGTETIEYQRLLNEKQILDDEYNLNKLNNQIAAQDESYRSAVEHMELMAESMGEFSEIMGRLGLGRITDLTEQIIKFTQDLSESDKKHGKHIAKMVGTSLQITGQIATLVADQIDSSSRRGFEQQKKARMAGASMDALGGALKGYVAGLSLPAPAPAPQIFAAFSAIAALGFGLMQVRKIAQTQYEGGGAGGGGATTPSVPGMSSLTTAAPTLKFDKSGDVDDSSHKSYVVSDDVETAGAVDRNVTANASF